MMFNYTMDNETLDAIHTVEVLKKYCGYAQCVHCPFYSFEKCQLMSEDCLCPADWEVPERE